MEQEHEDAERAERLILQLFAQKNELMRNTIDIMNRMITLDELIIEALATLDVLDDDYEEGEEEEW